MWLLYLVVQKTVTPHLTKILDALKDAKQNITLPKWNITDQDKHGVVFERPLIVNFFFSKIKSSKVENTHINNHEARKSLHVCFVIMNPKDNKNKYHDDVVPSTRTAPLSCSCNKYCSLRNLRISYKRPKQTINYAN